MGFFLNNEDTICAVATPAGSGAIAVIRLSGTESITLCDMVYRSPQADKKLAHQKSHTLHFGYLYDDNTIIDEVVVSLFRKPHSYTGEDVVEISCHGSVYVQQLILNLFIKNGARLAQAGEFTFRAYMNGKKDLLQAEAVADLIATQSHSAHQIAIQQMRGGFSSQLQHLRTQLLTFISLIELELDFSEEDVEFANRSELKHLITNIETHISTLCASFKTGNVLKNGVPVAIIGEPNVGKSTLLNVLLNEDKAIVSDIEGTTRDAIEDVISIKGILFRFIDTAGLRETNDIIENMGIERTIQKIETAEVILLLISSQSSNYLEQYTIIKQRFPSKKIIAIVNKSDLLGRVNPIRTFDDGTALVYISAKHRYNIDGLEKALLESINYDTIQKMDIIISNARHYEALTHAHEATIRVIAGLENNILSEFLAQDIRQVLHYIGEITGEFTHNEILGNIFNKFCVGK